LGLPVGNSIGKYIDFYQSDFIPFGMLFHGLKPGKGRFIYLFCPVLSTYYIPDAGDKC
jgi:hypothetical protein